jgi:hypothetical protein
MGYLIGGLGAFIALIVVLWRRSMSQSDKLITGLNSKLETTRKSLKNVVEKKNGYIHELETALISRLDPKELPSDLNRVFGYDPKSDDPPS